MFRTIIALTLTASALAAFIAGCSQAELTAEGQKVQITDQLLDPDNCTLKNTINIKAERNDPLGVEPEEIQHDINVMARNTAAAQGTYVLVPKGPPEGNSQSFTAYICKPAEAPKE
ncbi:MAG: DUF4156 domain-containing protein [Deltaproteobacteria bacterium]|nr:DUF4156 domain-containing protein [Deltaproteobacteria bacterium]